MQYRIKNWKDHQHFKDRTPPWIKLHRELLNDPEWFSLDGETGKALVSLWLIASEDKTMTGMLPSVKNIAFRLRKTEKEINQILNKLSHWVYQLDIKLISSCNQVDAPETETETETETDTEKKKPSAAFALPDWINADDWNLWIKTRKGKKLNDEQKQGYVDKLWKWMQGGVDYQSALKDAALAGWQGLHEPKAKFTSRDDKNRDIADHLAGRGKYAAARLD